MGVQETKRWNVRNWARGEARGGSRGQLSAFVAGDKDGKAGRGRWMPGKGWII